MIQVAPNLFMNISQTCVYLGNHVMPEWSSPHYDTDDGMIVAVQSRHCEREDCEYYDTRLYPPLSESSDD